MKLRKYPQLKFGVVLAAGALIAIVLCVQCVRTYLYIDAVLVPQHAEREAERQAGALAIAARSAAITDPRGLSAVMAHVFESTSDRVLWMRALDPETGVVAQAGKPEGTANVPAQWWQRVEAHASLGTVVQTAEGQAYVALLPFRMPHMPHQSEPAAEPPGPGAWHGGHRPGAYLIQLAVPLKAVQGAFDGLRQNVILGLITSLALLFSLAIIALRARHYFRGKYLEQELQLARRVQSDLYPKPHSVSSVLDFAASAIAADHVGGDFYDIFEADSGRVAIVLGDVSGTGIPAALLVSVLQGAIRSSTAPEHEHACERINRMLCERTACERFATLFWGVFDPLSGTLRYVNAGHSAPILMRHGSDVIERLDQGGPVLGFLPEVRYSAGIVAIDSADTLVVFSDGINEAANGKEEEFGDDRLFNAIADSVAASPAELCARVMKEVGAFASAGVPPDDRTLLVVRFRRADAIRQYRPENIGVRVVA